MVMIPYCEHFFALALRPGAMELEEQEEEEGKWVLFDCWVLHWFSKEPSLLYPGQTAFSFQVTNTECSGVSYAHLYLYMTAVLCTLSYKFHISIYIRQAVHILCVMRIFSEFV